MTEPPKKPHFLGGAWYIKFYFAFGAVATIAWNALWLLLGANIFESDIRGFIWLNCFVWIPMSILMPIAYVWGRWEFARAKREYKNYMNGEHLPQQLQPHARAFREAVDALPATGHGSSAPLEVIIEHSRKEQAVLDHMHDLIDAAKEPRPSTNNNLPQSTQHGVPTIIAISTIALLVFTTYNTFTEWLEIPYAYYTILRITVCFLCTWAAWTAVERQARTTAYILVSIAVLFNPIFPIELPRELWALIDVGAAIYIGIALDTYRRMATPAAP